MSKGRRNLKDLTINQLIVIADKWFSLKIRARDCGYLGMAKCSTCNSYAHYKLMDCGHFQKRSVMPLRYNENNTNIQCKACNSDHRGKGEQYKHGLYIDERWGKGTANHLIETAERFKNPESIKYFTREMLLEIIDRNKKEYKVIAKNKALAEQ